MLDRQTIEIIKSTVPVLEQHGEDITKKFYELLFNNHPELLNIFNHANQKQGRQQKALANTVYAAAKYIDQLEVIIPAVKQIAHKHRSLGILPEHYPIVGEHLLLAIKAVLGEAATDEIIEAWGNAYGVIADAFINTEKALYDKAGQQEGGWIDYREFIVEKVIKESNVITSFYFKPVDGNPIADFIPGQYISVRLKDIPNEQYNHIRQYSLSQSLDKSVYRISVKKEDSLENKPAGIVSTYLHNHVKSGDIVEISAPAGDFVLENHPTQATVLLSGGVGITPMLCMLHELASKNQETTFIHSAVNGNVHAFADEVKQVTKNNPLVKSYYCYAQPTELDKEMGAFDKEGYITAEWLKEVINSKDAIVYMCGPVSFMQAMYEALLEAGIKKENIRYEFFGPAMQLKEPQNI
ncbi:NO-inducible flavohemoprotein [Bacillus sp. S/N-304-OC-R1]|uniref:NO-inducible flavohemoprotein n=1 Tax=Bacillus sp. S/N-304-OC-R1 TaxID=2758034 RepID=UPI001C8D281E|nr:NO-inducible flavohemoprotein [Bacillus sp. S/N-304-OC-R1]MBY0120783.1 NO-inducible flavohemoprotein [Bacillus sp. S/N-304-OC-R1]